MRQAEPPPAQEGLRLDKWLFYARFFKTRGIAAERIEGGGIRLNGQSCRKPSRLVRAGDQLTISARGHVSAITVSNMADRRGPAAEAQTMYQRLSDGDTET